MILAEDGRKMSKSLGNVINPDDVVETLGADSLRLYEMFMGPLEDTKPWATRGIVGVRRFLERVWALQQNVETHNYASVETQLHKTIKKVTEDIEAMKFNTAVSAMMIFVNEAQKKGISAADFEKFLIILAPFAPHLAEELWSSFAKATEDKSQKKKYEQSIFTQAWPSYDENLIKDETLTIAIQVNGKLRDTIEVSADAPEDEVKKRALAREQMKKWIEGKEIKKIIFVKGRLLNIVLT